MARVKISLTQNTWTKVAENVMSGIIELRNLQPSNIWKTYVATGEAAPTDGNDTGNPFDLTLASPCFNRQLVISSTVAIDVYLFTAEKAGEVVVST